MNEERLADMLIAWEDRFEQGEDVPAADLCREWPELGEELAERIAALKRMNWLESQKQHRVTSEKRVQVEKVQDDPSRKPARNLCSGATPIPGYRLITKMGKGAFGEVWAALSDDNNLFAIKFFHGTIDATEARVRAEKELEGLTRIKKVNHPFVLEIHSLFVKNDALILITELADLSLEKLFAKFREKFPIVQRCAYALFLLQNTAEALDHLQARYDLLHLDIKPANLLLVKGVCKIGDFGTVFHFRSKPSPAREVLLSVPSSKNPDEIETVRYRSCIAVPGEKAFRRDATLRTAEGVFTPYYAPPEAFQGKNSRSFDQYSLALTFCELVAGEIPFKGDYQFIQRNEGRMELDFLPEPLRGVIRRALAPKADKRFPSCVAFVNALDVELEPLVKEHKLSNRKRWQLEIEMEAGDAQLHTAVARGIAEASESINLDPKNIRAYAIRAEAYLQKKEFDRAVTEASESIRLDPNYAFAYGTRADAFRCKNELDCAIADATQSIRIDPKNVRAYAIRAETYRQKKRIRPCHCRGERGHPTRS